MTVTSSPPRSSPITLVAGESTTLDAAALSALPTRERDLEIVCATGDRYGATWRGVPIPALLERASVPAETTHLLVEAAEGYRVCVTIDRALEGLLAVARDGEGLADVSGYDTRFVAPGIEGARAVKDVTRLETASLPPGADPESYEELWPDG